jgi:hypothetical protein
MAPIKAHRFIFPNESHSIKFKVGFKGGSYNCVEILALKLLMELTTNILKMEDLERNNINMNHKINKCTIDFFYLGNHLQRKRPKIYLLLP